MVLLCVSRNTEYPALLSWSDDTKLNDPVGSQNTSLMTIMWVCPCIVMSGMLSVAVHSYVCVPAMPMTCTP